MFHKRNCYNALVNAYAQLILDKIWQVNYYILRLEKLSGNTD